MSIKCLAILRACILGAALVVGACHSNSAGKVGDVDVGGANAGGTTGSPSAGGTAGSPSSGDTAGSPSSGGTAGSVGGGAAQGTLTLAQNDSTSYVIALANDAIPSEQTAASQLQHYFQQITGASIAIKPESQVSAGAPQILVGAGERARSLLPSQNWQSLGSDGIVIKTVGTDLILAGGRPRGTLYAVFQFLEDVAGCRWWTPTESTIPALKTFTVPAQNVVYIPPFAYREHYTLEVNRNPIFATIMRENGSNESQTSEWGGHYSMLGSVHTFSKLLPPETYFKAHPDWYSDPANGDKPSTAASKMPAAQDTQLCYSSPGVLDELTKNALAWIAKNPDAGIISISQNDNRNYCQDPADAALAKSEGSEAGPLLNFVNKVAARIHQQYPNFMVGTLAYAGTDVPPKTIRPASNMLIRLAPLNDDFGHPMNSDWNSGTRDHLLAWEKIAPRLFVWNYVTNFHRTMLPHPDWAGLGPDLRFFAANHVVGIFEQGDDYTKGVGDFVQMRTWVLAHLMWNPKLDQNTLIHEFLAGYYGAAAPDLEAYLDAVENSFLSQNRPLDTYNSSFSFITLDVANQAIDWFNQAEAAVQSDPILLQRVQRARLSSTIGILFRYEGLKRAAASSGKQFLGPSDPKAAMQDFIAQAKSFGVWKWDQSNSFSSEIPTLEKMFDPPLSLPAFAQSYPWYDVVDFRSPILSLGSIANLVQDPAASGDVAASVVNSKGFAGDWVIGAVFGNDLEASSSSNWHLYGVVRVTTNPGVPLTGTAFTTGIYDPGHKPVVGDRQAVSLAAVAGSQYKIVDLGEYPMNSGMQVFMALTANPAVNTIYVDRFILIRQ